MAGNYTLFTTKVLVKTIRQKNQEIYGKIQVTVPDNGEVKKQILRIEAGNQYNNISCYLRWQ